MTNNEIGIFMDPAFLESAKAKLTPEMAEAAARMNNKLPVDSASAWRIQVAAKQLKRFFNK